MRKYLVLQCVMSLVISCVSTDEDAQPFAEFDEANDLKCQPWSIDENTLGIYDLFQTGTTPPSFVAKVRRRNNTVQFHHRPIRNSEIAIEETRQLLLPDDVRILGPWQKNGKSLFVVNPDNDYRLEIRSDPENKVVYFDAFKRSPIFNETILEDSTGGFWMTYAIDDDKQEKVLEYYKWKGAPANMQFERKKIVGAHPDVTVDLMTIHENKFVIFYKMERKGRSWIEYQIIMPNGTVSPRVDLGVPIATKIDKWTVLSKDGVLFLAVVDGDSFLRQTVLRVARLSLQDKVIKTEWVNTKSLMNFHVSTPIWNINGGKTSLLVPKWLDDKSTLARYLVEKDGVVGTGHLGQFPNAASITGSFVDEPTMANYLIIRTKDQIGWGFNFCKLENE